MWVVRQEWIADTEAVEEVQVMDEVPHALRREISYAVNRKVFEKLHVFHDFPVSEQKSIAAIMTPLQVYQLLHPVIQPGLHVCTLNGMQLYRPHVCTYIRNISPRFFPALFITVPLSSSLLDIYHAFLSLIQYCSVCTAMLVSSTKRHY